MSVFGSRVSRLEGEAKHVASATGAPLHELEQLKERIQKAVTGSSTTIQSLEDKLIQYGAMDSSTRSKLLVWRSGFRGQRSGLTS